MWQWGVHRASENDRGMSEPIKRENDNVVWKYEVKIKMDDKNLYLGPRGHWKPHEGFTFEMSGHFWDNLLRCQNYLKFFLSLTSTHDHHFYENIYNKILESKSLQMYLQCGNHKIEQISVLSEKSFPVEPTTNSLQKALNILNAENSKI